MISETVFGKKSYEYAVGAIKATSHPPLTNEQLKRLSDTDKKGFLSMLEEFGWAKGLDGTTSERIEKEFARALNFIADIAPDSEICSLLFFEEDAQNLKLFLKGKLIGQDVTHLASNAGSVPPEIWRASVEACDYTLVSELLDIELKGIEKETDPFIISSLADRAFFAHTLNKAKKKNAPLYEMLTRYGAAKNKISQVRLKQMGVDISEISRLLLPTEHKGTPNDTRSDEEIINEANSEISKAMYDLRNDERFGPIAEYFFAKKNEAKTLRRLVTKYETETEATV